jgi:ATP-binding cassette subfamily F protein 3
MEDVFAELKAQKRQLRKLESAMADPARREEAVARYGSLLDVFETSGGYAYRARIEQVLAGLGFDPEEFYLPLTHLSGGQRTRALLARVLLEDPDLLLLDEPTNHLDLNGIEWLEGYLTSWKKAMVVVAHDRAFLDQVAEQVWELAFGRLTIYRGNYSQYVVQREERRARQQERYERQQAEIARTKEFIRRYKAGQRSRQARGREKQLARLERVKKPRDVQPMSMDLGDPLRSGDLVLGLYGLTVGYDAREPLFVAEKAELRRGQRAALVGPNGVGKTTLLRTILGQVEPLAGRVRVGAGVRLGYFAQAHAGLDHGKTILETILDAGLHSISRARDLLGRYRFSGDEVFKRVGDLSGGEKARVALAVLALQGANFLLLDEPTNHLDISSQEVLQEVLSSFEGTVLLVTHDRYLIQALTSRVWAIVGRRLWLFGAGYEAYRTWVEQRRQKADLEEEGSVCRNCDEDRRVQKAAQRRAERRARQVTEIEEAIQRLEAQKVELEAELEAASAAQQVEQVAELGAEYSRLQAELDAKLALWEELA